MDAEEEKEQACCREAGVKELARQQGETAQSRSPRQPQPKGQSLSINTNLAPSALHSQPLLAAKRKVGVAISYLDSTHIVLGSHGLR